MNVGVRVEVEVGEDPTDTRRWCVCVFGGLGGQRCVLLCLEQMNARNCIPPSCLYSVWFERTPFYNIPIFDYLFRKLQSVSRISVVQRCIQAVRFKPKELPCVSSYLWPLAVG